MRFPDVLVGHLFFVILAVFPSCASTPAASPESIYSSHRPVIDRFSLEKEIHRLVNRQRLEHGLAPLKFDPALSSIARGHSRDMARRRYFAHLSPEGVDFSGRYQKGQYVCSVRVGSVIYLGAENLALNSLYASVLTKGGKTFYDWNSSERVAATTVQGWMESLGHRKNILTPEFSKEGIGVEIAPDDRIYITQNFC
jgi:uncharacterized protein YkwD